MGVIAKLSLITLTLTGTFILGVKCGQGRTILDIQHEAVQKGVGEWVIEYQEKDFSDVKRSFRWKLPR